MSVLGKYVLKVFVILNLFLILPSFAQEGGREAQLQELDQKIQTLFSKIETNAALNIQKFIQDFEALREADFQGRSVEDQFEDYHLILHLYSNLEYGPKLKIAVDEFSKLASPHQDEKALALVSLYEIYADYLNNEGGAWDKKIEALINTPPFHNSPELRIDANRLFAMVLAGQDDLFGAASTLLEVLETNRIHPEFPMELIDSLWSLGFVYSEISDSDKVLNYYIEALDAAKEHKLPIDAGTFYYNLASVFQYEANWDVSLKFWDEYETFSRNKNIPQEMFFAHYGKALLYFEKRDYAQSKYFADLALNDPYSKNNLSETDDYNIGLIQIQAFNEAFEGNIESAERYFAELKVYQLNHPEFEGSEWDNFSLKIEAEIAFQKGDHKLGYEKLREFQERNYRISTDIWSQEYSAMRTALEKNIVKKEAEKTQLIQDAKFSKLEIQNQNIIFYVAFIILVFFLVLIVIQFRYQKILQKNVKLAEEANRAKSDFLANMSHEFRTPLNAIIGFSESLKVTKFGPLNDQQRDFVNYIYDGGNILLKLINDILDLAKIESSAFRLHMGNHKIKHILEDVVPMMHSLLEKKQATLHLDGNIEGDIKIHVDEMRMKQILMNLISNGIKYGHQRGNVWVEATETVPGFLRVSVRDDGRGISQTQYHNVFKPFNRAGMENSEVEKTGAGLSIVQKLVESMEGTIDFESEIGMGSIFWVDFKIVKE